MLMLYILLSLNNKIYDPLLILGQLRTKVPFIMLLLLYILITYLILHLSI